MMRVRTGQDREQHVSERKHAGVLHDLRVLSCHPTFVFSCLANCPGTGVFGALSYWGPHVSCPLWTCPGIQVVGDRLIS